MAMIHCMDSGDAVPRLGFDKLMSPEFRAVCVHAHLCTYILTTDRLSSMSSSWRAGLEIHRQYYVFSSSESCEVEWVKTATHRVIYQFPLCASYYNWNVDFPSRHHGIKAGLCCLTTKYQEPWKSVDGKALRRSHDLS